MNDPAIFAGLDYVDFAWPCCCLFSPGIVLFLILGVILFRSFLKAWRDDRIY